MVSQHLQRSTSDLSSSSSRGNGDTVRERGSHLHTVVIPVNTSCSHCDQHFESVAMLLEHLRTFFFFWKGMQNWALTLSSGTSDTRPQRTKRPSRRTGAAEPRHTEANAAHSVPPGLETRSGDSRATFRTLLVNQDEPLMLANKGATGLFVAKSKEGQRPPGEPHVYGWAAMMTAKHCTVGRTEAAHLSDEAEVIFSSNSVIRAGLCHGIHFSSS